MACLPQEIIFHAILPKLPVKSICRFKCVSRSFLALFTDSLFIKTHLSQTHRDKFLVLPNSDLYLIDLETSSNDEKLAATRLDFSKERVETLGSCNGLFCFYVNERRVFFFYNPSTRECSMAVPNYMNKYLQTILLQSFPVLKWNDDCPTAGDGFGYALSIDDYKMVILSGWKYVTHVFSLRNNSWKTVHQYEENLLGCGTLLNGALHWLAFSPTYSPDNRYSIVSFDLVEEKFISSLQEHAIPIQYQTCSGQIHNRQADADGKPVNSTPSNQTGNAPAMFDIEAGGAVLTTINSSSPSKTVNHDHKLETSIMLGGQIISVAAAVWAKNSNTEMSSEAKCLWYFLLACVILSLISFIYGLFLSGYERLHKAARVMRTIGIVATMFVLVIAIGLHLPNELMVWGTLGVCALSALAILCFALKY